MFDYVFDYIISLTLALKFKFSTTITHVQIK